MGLYTVLRSVQVLQERALSVTAGAALGREYRAQVALLFRGQGPLLQVIFLSAMSDK